MGLEQYDAALLGILQNEGEVAKFLVVICGFLYRRTDFYVYLTPDGRMGFPPGVSKKILLAAYKKFEDLANADRARKAKLKAESELQERMDDVPPCGRIEEVTTSTDNSEPTNNNTPFVDSGSSAAPDNSQATADASLLLKDPESIPSSDSSSIPSPCVSSNTTCVGTSNVDITNDANFTAGNKEELKSSKSSSTNQVTEEKSSDSSQNIFVKEPSPTNKLSEQASNNESLITSPDGANSEVVGQMKNNNSDNFESSVVPMETAQVGETKSETEKKKPSGKESDEEEDSELSRQQKIFQMSSESYNGAVRDNYSWSQSITDVDVRIKVPRTVKKGKDVKVEISRRHLKATYCDEGGKFVVAVDDDLTWDVNKEESIWSLVSSEHIHVNLEKREERWWDALLVGEPKINVRKIDASRPMTDLGDEEQAKIDELMYNERQKRLGLPQSHEKNVHEMLKKAWDVEGSPFKGQPFDPSVINISPGPSS